MRAGRPRSQRAEALRGDRLSGTHTSTQPGGRDADQATEEVFVLECLGYRFFVDIGTGAFQLDGRYRTSIITNPPDGRYPPLSAVGQQRSERLAPFRHENTGTAWWMHLPVGPYDDPELRPLAERCILTRGASGPPSMPGMYNNLKTIVQTDDHVMILIEWMHDARIIRLDSEHLPDSVRKWSGEYPWPATGNRLYEYGCHEGNYALGGILRGARLLEQEAIEQDASGASTGSGSGD